MVLTLEVRLWNGEGLRPWAPLLLNMTALMWVGMQIVTMELNRHFAFDLTLWLLGIVRLFVFFFSFSPLRTSTVLKMASAHHASQCCFHFLGFRVLQFVLKMPTINLNAVKKSYQEASVVVEGIDTLFVFCRSSALSLWHLSFHLSSETTLLDSLILTAQGCLGISLGNSEASSPQGTVIKTTTTTTAQTHSCPTYPWPAAVEEGVPSPTHAKATPAGYRMETWNKRKRYPMYCSSPNQLPLPPAQFSGQNC